jgi:hypothetical protein
MVFEPDLKRWQQEDHRQGKECKNFIENRKSSFGKQETADLVGRGTRWNS